MHEVESNWRDKIFTVNHVNVIWGISGMGKIVIDGKEHDLPPEHLAVLLPGMQQEIYGGEQGWEYCWWTMDGPMAVSETHHVHGLSAAPAVSDRRCGESVDPRTAHEAVGGLRS